MGEILEECVGDLEKCQSYPLAEKMGFDVDRFSKITGPTNSAS
jgi:hypothetical protein